MKNLKIKNLFVDVRKVTVATLCALLVCFVAVSCDRHEVPGSAKIPNGGGNDSIIPVLVGKGNLYGNGAEGIPQQNMVITTSTAWNTLINRMNSVNNVSDSFTETDIDFSQYQVIAVFDEIRGSGGWSIDITDITEGDSIVVTYTSLKPGDFFTDVMTQPYHIVKIPVSNKVIVFQNY